MATLYDYLLAILHHYRFKVKTISIMRIVLAELKGGGRGGDPFASHWGCCLPTEEVVDESIHTASSTHKGRGTLHPGPKLGKDGG